VDFQHPVEAVIPGVQGRILGVLGRTTAELNLRTIARLAEVSPAQVSRVLPSLVDLGVVDRREAPPSALFRLNDSHMVTAWVRELADARAAVLDRMADAAAQWAPAPVSVVVFGSFARGEATEASDIDVVAVRPDGITDDRWFEPLETWRSDVRNYSGNAVEVISVDRREASASLRGRKPLWREVVHDGVVVFGASLDELRADRG
jgi:predicted nucleotidyltransferase